MFSKEKPLRPPRRRKSSVNRSDEMETFCGQFPNRLKRNFSSDVLNNNLLNDFEMSHKRNSNLEINRTMSQNGSPFVPLFGPNIHPLMGQMWKPLRHSQVINVKPEQQKTKTEVKPKKSFDTFEDHFNQYKGVKQYLKEPKQEMEFIHRKSVDKRALSSEKMIKNMRKASLPLETESLNVEQRSLELPVPVIERKKERTERISLWFIILFVANVLLLGLFVILMIY